MVDVRTDKCAGKPVICSREEAMADLVNICSGDHITQLFAYNSMFDKMHLPELGGPEWYDIMRLLGQPLEKYIKL